MKKIVLLGDSIRGGYDKYVKHAFCGIAEVYYPKENCRFASYILRHLPDWKRDFDCGDDVEKALNITRDVDFEELFLNPDSVTGI
jgi:hypothetical protein